MTGGDIVLKTPSRDAWTIMVIAFCNGFLALQNLLNWRKKYRHMPNPDKHILKRRRDAYAWIVLNSTVSVGLSIAQLIWPSLTIGRLFIPHILFFACPQLASFANVTLLLIHGIPRQCCNHRMIQFRDKICRESAFIPFLVQNSLPLGVVCVLVYFLTHNNVQAAISAWYITTICLTAAGCPVIVGLLRAISKLISTSARQHQLNSANMLVELPIPPNLQAALIRAKISFGFTGFNLLVLFPFGGLYIFSETASQYGQQHYMLISQLWYTLCSLWSIALFPTHRGGPDEKLGSSTGAGAAADNEAQSTPNPKFGLNGPLHWSPKKKSRKIYVAQTSPTKDGSHWTSQTTPYSNFSKSIQEHELESNMEETGDDENSANVCFAHLVMLHAGAVRLKLSNALGIMNDY